MTDLQATNFRKTLRWVAGIGMGLGLIAFIYIRGHSIDQIQHAAVLQFFSEAELADRLLSKTVIEATYRARPEFEDITQAMSDMKIAQTNLTEELDLLASQAPEFALLGKVLNTDMEEKFELIDSIKAEKVVMHNSFSYLPISVKELQQSSDNAADLRMLYELSEELIHLVMLFSVTREYEEQEMLRQVILDLSSESERNTDLPLVVQASLEETVMHSRDFFEATLKVEQLLSELKQSAWHTDLERLKSQYTSWFEDSEREAKRYQAVGPFIATSLVLLVALQVYRLNSARRQERKLFRRIKALAYEDKVTGLKSRNFFFDALNEKLSKHKNGAIILIDINRFKSINQAMGHEFGDKVLNALARKIDAHVTDQDIAARLEGNRFAILLAGIDKEEELIAKLRSLIDTISEPITVEGESFELEISTSGACFPKVSNRVDPLMRTVEATLAEARSLRSQFKISSQAAEVPDDGQVKLFGELRRAIDENQLKLLYQPKLDLRSKTIVAVEALVRWDHPSRGQIPPGLFIPFAEKTGLIRPLTHWVINQAARDAVTLQRSGKTVTFSVNVSAFDITGPYFVLNVQDCLDRTGLAPNLLCLEITESAFMAEPEKSLNRLHLLKDKGLKLSIDDYGTGMASLAYVRDLPVDELKVDRSFITWIHKQDRNAAIVKNTISMCHDLNISIVAEGVETMDEFNWINTHGFDQAQGYFISHPLTIEELTRKLSEGS